MRVLLVGSAEQGGISEHSAYLMEALQQADPTMEIGLHTDLHPDSAPRYGFDICHVNYHSALHSQWKPEHFARLKAHTKTVVTWHDSGVPNSDHCLSIYAVADAFVVHEPCEDLPTAHYWRQGIPDWQAPTEHPTWAPSWARRPPHRKPRVGTVGFPFGWKNYDLLCQGAAAAGWEPFIIAPTATNAQMQPWLDAGATVIANFLPAIAVVRELSDCDATAFLYNCHNTGTSGAIRQGIAARKPVIATRFPAGRQFRDLQEDPLGKRVITWIEPTLHAVTETLSRVDVRPIHAGMVHLAERDSWKSVGERYAKLYRSLVQR